MPQKIYTVTWRKLTETDFQSVECDTLENALDQAKLRIVEESDKAMFGYEVRIITTATAGGQSLPDIRHILATKQTNESEATGMKNTQTMDEQGQHSPLPKLETVVEQLKEIMYGCDDNDTCDACDGAIQLLNHAQALAEALDRLTRAANVDKPDAFAMFACIEQAKGALANWETAQ